ncbi:MAG: phosphoglucomutase (alpha-D-glucose-1,6-bisphosphate-dependent) [Polyangiales bacterium]
MTHPLAGKPAPPELIVDVEKLRSLYANERPDPKEPSQRVAFGTSGHRGTSLKRAFNEAHILAIVQATCEYRKSKGIDGPMFLGMDTHALSTPAQRTALEVLAAHGITVFLADGDVPTPTPVVSHAILAYNRGRKDAFADGLIITPSHNPPEDGGIKYNPPNGGPSDSNVSGWIEKRANELLANPDAIARTPYERARKAGTTKVFDFVTPYVKDLRNALELDSIRGAKLSIGADPLGGSNVAMWAPIAAEYDLHITVVNPNIDPTFKFMPLDHDGKIRMDCSSPWAMANLVALKDKFDLAFGNDADSDRHGIVTRSSGLLNPNHYLSAAINYLFSTRNQWSAQAAIGKTLVSSSMIDRVAKSLGKRLVEVPVGFKYFVDGLLDGSIAFGGEESAGASFVRRDGTVWTTDKDGILLDLLAVEMLAKTGDDPGIHYRKLTDRFGAPIYSRIDQPATTAQKNALKKLSPEAVSATTLGGDPIVAKLTKAPGNGADIGGLKVVTEMGWFAARPSGTEDVYKIYAESFRGEEHLKTIQDEARKIVADAFAASER